MKLFLTLLFSLSIFFLPNTVQAKSPETKEISLKDILNKDEQSVAKKTSSQQDLAEYNDVPEDEYNRGQPRGTIEGFISAAKENDFETAIQYLDYRNITKSTMEIGKEELARQLFVVLNRTVWLDPNSISNLALGDRNDDQPSYRERIASIETRSGNIDILLQRIPRAIDRVKIWKISNATVSRIPTLSKEYAYTPLGEWLSIHLPAVNFLGVMLWQWLYFFYSLLVFFIVAKISTWIFSRALKSFNPKTSTDTQHFIEKPLALLLTVILVRIFMPEENATVASKAVSEGATLLTIASLWVLFRFVDLLKLRLADRFVKQDKPLAVYLLRPAGTVVKSIILVVVALIWFENLGFSASTLLAGLGIGGLAIALAAQKTVENIIGAITLYTSTPVKIGDLCRFGQKMGVVEEIGLRATRIRTLERTVIHVANAQFIDMQIENYSERERIAYRPTLRLNPQSENMDVKGLLDDIIELLTNNAKISTEPLRANLKAFTSLGIELDVLSYVETTSFEEYLKVINQLNLAVLVLLKQHNCELVVLSDRDQVH